MSPIYLVPIVCLKTRYDGVFYLLFNDILSIQQKNKSRCCCFTEV